MVLVAAIFRHHEFHFTLFLCPHEGQTPPSCRSQTRRASGMWINEIKAPVRNAPAIKNINRKKIPSTPNIAATDAKRTA
jgi:hypothetical protein